MYTNISNLKNIGGIPTFINFLNRTLCLTVSKALDMSIQQTNTSDPFLEKYEIVSRTLHVHITVEQPDWYAYCNSSRPNEDP